jgi:hypothetical protein
MLSNQSDIYFNNNNGNIFNNNNLSMSGSGSGINVSRFVDNKSLINVTNLSELESKLFDLYSFILAL